MSNSSTKHPLSLTGILVSIAFLLLSFDTVWNSLVDSIKKLFENPTAPDWLLTLTGAFLAILLLVTGILGLFPNPKRRAIRILSLIILVLSAAFFIMGLMQFQKTFPFISIQTPMLVQAILAWVLYCETK